MSWDQEYSIPSVQDLLEQLVKKTSMQLLEQHLKDTQGLTIEKIEEVEVTDGFISDVIGQKVTLSDGRVFVPKLVERFTENGNHGVDIFQYVLESENPNVRHIDADTTNPDIDVFDIPEGYTDTTLLEYDENERGC